MKDRCFAYTLFGDILCYADCANARQKIRLVGETLKGVVFIPKGRRDLIPPEAKDGNFEEVDVPRGIWALVRFVRARRNELSGFGCPVSGEKSFLVAIALSLFSGVPIFLFCWDPPGVSARNRRDVISRLRCKALDVLTAIAVSCSKGMILNLHPGFLEGRFSASVRRKIFTFPNGTTIQKNESFAKDAKRVPKRFAVACRVNEQKGCWDVAHFFLELYKRDPEVSLVWIGGGKDRDMYEYFLKHGVPGDRVVMTGNVEREDSLRHIATASLAINLYPDVPSLRWNYVLKAPEFLSFGLPVVTYDMPGVRAYVIDGETGLVVPPGEVNQAVEKTLDLLNDVSRYETMCAAARERASRYDWLLINQAIAGKVNELLGGNV